MVFSSATFLFLFLPLVLLLSWAVPRRLRNGTLLLASLVFYAWGSGPFVLALIASALANFGLGLLAHRGERGSGVRKWATAGSVIVSLGLLGYFKYANFFVDQLNAALESLGTAPMEWTRVVLPIGISFYSFQSMSYVIDIAREKTEPLRNPLDFALYLAMFPQLIAGPIVRYHHVAAELRERSLKLEQFSSGAVRFGHGLVKKVLVADAVGSLADSVFATPGTELGAAAAWIGVWAYHLQIYFDFSAYSDMAIGLGKMLGFRFPENFDRPYSATSMTDFWRRWHMTLSFWFRDYLYIPLGGSKGSGARTYFNLAVVFLVTGLWHGANWTFVAWGAYHGVILMAERATGFRDGSSLIPLRRALNTLLVMLGWTIFRADSLGHAGQLYGSLFSFRGWSLPADVLLALSNRSLLILLLSSCVVLLPTRVRMGPYLMSGRGPLVAGIRLALMIGMLYVGILIISGTYSPFLYFQF